MSFVGKLRAVARGPVSLADWCQALIVGYAVCWRFDAVNATISPGGYNLVEAKAAHACAATVLALLPFWLPRAWRRGAWLAIALLTALLATVDAMYLRYFDAVPPVRALLYGGQAMGVRHSLAALWRPADAFMFTDVLLLAALWRFRPAPTHPFPRLERVAATLGILAALVRVGGLVADFDARHPRALATAWNPRYISASLGLFTYHMVDVYNTARSAVSLPLPDADVARIAGWLDRPQPPAIATFPHANLIVVQVEALQQFVMDREVEGREIAPNLDRFERECLYFPNLYGQTGDGNTADAEFMTNTSLYPLDHGAAYVCYPHNDYASIARRLAPMGYRSVALHANAPAFWNRYMVYPALGFADFVNAQGFTQDEQVGPGLGDRSFLRQGVAKLEHLPRPFHAQLVTLSSHHPYDDVAHFGSFPVGPYEHTMLGNYLKGIHYADGALGGFFEALRRDGLLDTSVVVVYGDHPALGKPDFAPLAKLVAVSPDDRLAWLKQQKVPLLIHVPHGMLKGVRPAPAGQIDIMPTAARLLGAPTRGTFGRDLLAPGPARVVLRDGSVIEDGTYYDATERRAYDMATQQPIARPVDAALTTGATHLAYSNAIVKHDLQPRLKQAWRGHETAGALVAGVH